VQPADERGEALLALARARPEARVAFYLFDRLHARGEGGFEFRHRHVFATTHEAPATHEACSFAAMRRAIAAPTRAPSARAASRSRTPHTAPQAQSCHGPVVVQRPSASRSTTNPACSAHVTPAPACRARSDAAEGASANAIKFAGMRLPSESTSVSMAWVPSTSWTWSRSKKGTPRRSP